MPFRRSRSRGIVLAGLLAGPVVTLPLASTPAAAARQYVYDRLAWNPAGDSLVVLAWPTSGPADTAPFRVLVPVAGGAVTLAANARDFLVAPDRSAILLLGDGGLWWRDQSSGEVRQLFLQPAGATERIVDYAFRHGAPGALFYTGAPGDRGGSFYRFDPAAGVERIAPHLPGAPPPDDWGAEAEPQARPPVAATRSPRRFTVSGSPNLGFDFDGRTITIDTGYAGNRIPLSPVTIEWASWPGEGAIALLSLRDSGTNSCRLFVVRGGSEPKPVFSGETPVVAWIDATTALVNDSEARLYRFDGATDTLQPLPLDTMADWARRLGPEAEVPTLRITRWPRSARRFESQQALIAKCAKELPAELRAGASAFGHRLEGGEQSVGVYPDLAAAAYAADLFRKSGVEAEPTKVLARDMSGAFDYGFKRNGPGDQAFIRRLGNGTEGCEIWLTPVGQEPRRILTSDMTR